MARTASPWYWEPRRCWAVIVDGRRHILGDHPPGPPPRKKGNKWVAPRTIRERFDDLKVGLRNPAAAPAALPTEGTVAGAFDKFLDWCQKNRSPRTYEWSRTHLLSFVRTLLSPKTFPVSSLKPFHVQEWADAAPGWGPNHKRGAITAVQRAFNWAEKAGHVERSPVRGVEKPPPKRREQVLSRPEFLTVLSHVKDRPFRDVLEFCWETGARVQEVRLIRAAHYRPDRGRIEIPPPEAKGKRRWRVVYLTPPAEAIVRRLAPLRPEGPLFRNADGNPWDAQNFNCRFGRLEKKLGVKYALTALRHSFCQRLLEAGVDHTTVAALMGHSNAVMVSTTYSHMDQAKDFLRSELLKAAGGGTA